MVMEVLDKAHELEKQGIDIVHMEVGEPDFEMPEIVKKASIEAIEKGLTHYTHSLGDISLRCAISAFYKKEYGVHVDPECIIVTSGSSPAILMTLMTLCSAGDEVIVSNPGYPCYKNFAIACNAVPVDVNVYASDNFQFQISEVKKAISSRTRAIFVNSPMNPCGTLVDDIVYKQLISTGIPIISDEIYQGLVYQGKARSILEFTDEAFVINGFSKRFAMTGMRLGYIIAPKKYVRTLQILQQNLFICAPSISQYAAISALEHGHEAVEKMRIKYNERRLFVIKRLKDMGFEISHDPVGAFYIFCNASKFTKHSHSFAFDILEKAHVGICPGIDFGSNGEGYVRFSYTNSMDRLEEGLCRLENYLK